MSNESEQDTVKRQPFIRATMELLWKEAQIEWEKPHIRKIIQESICDPILDYCIQQLTPYYILLVIIFIVLLIVIAVLLAFIIFSYKDSRSI